MRVLLNELSELNAFRKGIEFFDGEVEMHQGRYVICANSVLGIFSLDLSKPVDVTINCTSDRVRDNFYDYLRKWSVD